MLKHNLYLLFLLFLSSSSLASDKLLPFTTDGCSAFPEGTLQQQNLWLDCCIKHDIAYWKGGTYLQRLQADEELMHCVSQQGEPAISIIMMVGVRVGGTPLIPTSFRWGYGWPYPRGYGELTEADKVQIRHSLSQLEL